MSAGLVYYRKVFCALSLSVIFLSSGLIFSGVYLHTKAVLAQVLLERSWLQTKNSEQNARVKPWPWADTYPVAKIRFPRLNWRSIVLEGATGEALAFGPGHLLQTVRPGEFGNSVIAGHRDTHFKVLRWVRIGEKIVIELADRQTVNFTVTEIDVVHERDVWVTDNFDALGLTLITCYPFDASSPGGPLRLIVRAIGQQTVLKEHAI